MSISKFKKSKTLFLPSLSCYSHPPTPLLKPPPTDSLSSSFTSHPILLLHSFRVPPQFFCSISLSLSFLSMVFLQLSGFERGYRIGDSVLSDARELQKDIGDYGCETTSVCKLYVRHSESLYLSPQLPPLMQPQEWDVERKAM